MPVWRKARGRRTALACRRLSATKDAKKEDRTIVNHFHGVSSSAEAWRNVWADRSECLENSRTLTETSCATKKQIPKSLKLEHRERSAAQREPGQLEDFIRAAREVMQRELQERCFDRKILTVPTARHECTESSPASVQHRGNFVHDIPP